MRTLRFRLLWLTLLLASGVTACAMSGDAAYRLGQQPDILIIYPDGSMRLNDRPIDSSNVVIYPDGRGGEMAAVKVRVPVHPDYYRSTIIVERKAWDPQAGEDD